MISSSNTSWHLTSQQTLKSKLFLFFLSWVNQHVWRTSLDQRITRCNSPSHSVFLATKHSIQTSILSKRWINLWKFTTVIDIQMATRYNEITPSERTFIHNTFKLRKFSLDFFIGALWNPGADVQLQHFELAISRQVHILSVSTELLFATFEEHYVLPNVFYSHDNVPSLVQVSLKGFLFNPNPICDLPFASLKAVASLIVWLTMEL